MQKKCKYGQTESGRPYLPHPTYEEYKQGLHEWEKQFPDRVKISVIGKTLKDNDIILCKITDFNVPPDDKQVFLYTCTHVGVELNAMTSGLHFIKWLLADSELAAETRKKQIALFVLVAMPDAYLEQRYASDEQGEGSPTAGYYSWKGVLKPEKNPEAVALVKLMDEYQPDFAIDAHGFAQADASMCESTGVSGGSALVSHTWEPKIIDMMIEAADNAGFGVRATNGEWGGGFMQCTGEILAQYRANDIGPEYNDCFKHELCAHHFFYKESNISLSVYAYHLYHTMATIMEIGIEQAAVAQLKKLMEIGNSRWITECHAGYPVNFMGYGQCVALAGYGQTALERRKSRVEIWKKYNQFALGYCNPPNRGDIIGIVAANSKGAEYLFPDPAAGRQKYESVRNSLLQQNIVYNTFDKLLDRLQACSDFNVDPMRKFMANTSVDRYHANYTPMGFPEKEEPLELGLGIRLFIPFAGVKIKEVLMNGRPLPESEINGWHSWGGSGTVVQVNLPPGTVEDLHIIQCAYEPVDNLPCGFSEEDWSI